MKTFSLLAWIVAWAMLALWTVTPGLTYPGVALGAMLTLRLALVALGLLAMAAIYLFGGAGEYAKYVAAQAAGLPKGLERALNWIGDVVFLAGLGSVASHTDHTFAVTFAIVVYVLQLLAFEFWQGIVRDKVRAA